MAYTARRQTSEPAPPKLPELSATELADVAGKHIADLIDHEHRAAIERRPTPVPRARRFGRVLVLGWLSIVETFASAWRWLKDPRHISGRLMARPRLWRPSKTFGWWTVLLLVLAGGVAYVRLGPAKGQDPWETVTAAFFGALLIAAVVVLWHDLFRLPFLAWTIRRRIARDPERVLRSSLLAKWGNTLVERLPLEIVPRAELYEDLLPGVLAHDRKDVQIIAGDAGAGKTTALLAVAQLLARNGILPVLVPLRSQTRTELVKPAEDRFHRQVEARVRSKAESELLWRWLVLRRRVAILVDDIDQVAPDGERGLVMRKMLDEASESELSVIVTARSAGVPAGVAASAIDLGSLDEHEAVKHVIATANAEPSANCRTPISRRRIEEWVKEGKLAEVPFYLELLAALSAVGQCPPLAQASSTTGGAVDVGRVYRRAGGERVWNPLWVRYRLLEHYREQLMLGRVRRSLGIEPRERRSALRALEDAALGMLVASSLDARMKLKEREIGEGTDRASHPLRRKVEEFIDANDRRDLKVEEQSRSGSAQRAPRRQQVSVHEVIDAGERLGVLDLRGEDETTAFHHRIMQAYLAARCLVRRERQAKSPENRSNPATRPPQGERDWIAALLDHRHPDKLTAHMALGFAAMYAREIQEAPLSTRRGSRGSDWNEIGKRIVTKLVQGARAIKEGNLDDDDDDANEQAPLLVTLLSESESEATQVTLALAPEGASAEDGQRDLDAQLLDPLRRPDFERRSDPDDALLKLVTAAEIVRAAPKTATAVLDLPKTDAYSSDSSNIAEEMRLTPGATRWTKRRAVEALAVPSNCKETSGRSEKQPFEEESEPSEEASSLRALGNKRRWHTIWNFACDIDYEVKRAASKALEEHAYESFVALAETIETLIARAAARSAYGRNLMRPEKLSDKDGNGQVSIDSLLRMLRTGDGQQHKVESWTKEHDIEALEALGTILPAIVSGFREDPSIELEGSGLDDDDDDDERTYASGTSVPGGGDRKEPERNVMCHPPRTLKYRIDYARRAERALRSLVALAFEGPHGNLEAAVAQGFRSDALRHAMYPERDASGPGWVVANRELVAGVCLDHATFWFARIALYQALAMYAVAGADAQETHDIISRHMRFGGNDRHPFTRRAARLARAAVRRSQLRSDRWQAYVWNDEGNTTGDRAAKLATGTAQLVADVTLLLNLNEHSPEERQETFVQMQTLPYCLSGSRDRSEILGEGCPPQCGWNLCPYKQAPPDEPDAHPGVRRSFCRRQRGIALRRRLPWQHSIHRGKLREFWREMERRART